MAPSPNYDAALEFLQRWSPAGPWILTSVTTDKRSINTATLGDGKQVRGFLNRYGAKRNIYFMVNPSTRDLSKKSDKSDVQSLAWLHVDIDPRSGEPLDAERERALKLLTDPPGEVPKPHVVVFSGGGYQGFWKLDPVIPIGGDVAKAEEAERLNRQLESVFGADACHNADRIMRLPGTINWPDAKKLEKGRVPTLATLSWFDDGSYDPGKFTPSPKVQASTGYGEPIVVSGNVKRLNSVDDLPKEATDLLKVAIVQGTDPDNPARWPSRSEALWFVCCALVRIGVEDEVVYSIITDPSFAISSSVLDKRSQSDAYAMKQIRGAKEHAVDPNLQELNAKHAVISDVGGRCRILSEVVDATEGDRVQRVSFQSFQDFAHRYCNRFVMTTIAGKDVPTPLGKWWISHSLRRQYDTIVFAPGQDVPGAYNLWNGFAYDPRPGDCELLLKHVKDNTCQGDETLYEYLVNWMAIAVQRPDQQGHVAIVLRGRKGTGKSFIATAFGSLFGRHFLHVSDSKHVVGSFNAHLRDCVVLFGDEAFYAGDQSHESTLKTLITEDRIMVEPKGVDAETATNCLHLIMASDGAWVVPAGVDERRFLVLDVGDERMKDYAYFHALQEQLDNGGYEAFLWFLLNRDLSNFNPRMVPGTEALQEQKIRSFSVQEEWWFAKLRDGQLFPGEAWPPNVVCTRLQRDFTETCRLWGQASRSNSTKLGLFMAQVLPEGQAKIRLGGKVKVIMLDGLEEEVDRPYAYLTPSLADARAIWDDRFGGPYGWPEDDVTEVESDDDDRKSEF